MDLGTNLKLLRIARSISQKELADKVGITHNYLSMIENDKKRPSLTLLEKLAKTLGTSIATIFTPAKLG